MSDFVTKIEAVTRSGKSIRTLERYLKKVLEKQGKEEYEKIYKKEDSTAMIHKSFCDYIRNNGKIDDWIFDGQTVKIDGHVDGQNDENDGQLDAMTTELLKTKDDYIESLKAEIERLKKQNDLETAQRIFAQQEQKAMRDTSFFKRIFGKFDKPEMMQIMPPRKTNEAEEVDHEEVKD